MPYGIMTLREKFDILLKRKGISQTQLAKRAGFGQTTVNRWINGLVSMSMDQAFALARELEVPLDYLADPSQEGEPGPLASERERQVREIAEKIGWEAAYWRIVKAEALPEVKSVRKTLGQIKEDARKAAEEVRKASGDDVKGKGKRRSSG